MIQKKEGLDVKPRKPARGLRGKGESVKDRQVANPVGGHEPYSVMAIMDGRLWNDGDDELYGSPGVDFD